MCPTRSGSIASSQLVLSPRVGDSFWNKPFCHRRALKVGDMEHTTRYVSRDKVQKRVAVQIRPK